MDERERILTPIALRVAMDAAIAASNLVLQYWPSASNPHFNQTRTMEIFKKEDGIGNYATIADRESEAVIIAMIRSEPLFTEHQIVGEESGEKGIASAWRWVIDPIDGTPPFRHGLPEFGISIGLLYESDPIVGVIAIPARGEIIIAQRGEGAMLLSLDRRIIAAFPRKGTPVALNYALVGYDLGYTDRARRLTAFVAKIADKIGYPVSYGSCSTANFRLAQGEIHAYFYENPTPYDIAAAATIIPAVGGVVTNMEGKPIDWNAPTRGYLAAVTPELHRELLALLNN